MNLNTVLNEEFKKNKKAAKNLKKHWKEIQNIEYFDFGKLYQHLQIQHIHRLFKGTDVSFLAIFTVFEFLHNFNTFIDNINSERRMKAINEAAGMEICVVGPANSGKGVSSVMPTLFSEEKNCRPFMIEHYQNLINRLKEGEISVRPEVWNYIINGKNMTDEEKKEIEKHAANEAINMLKFPRDIIGFIEKSIEGNYKISS